MLVFLPDDPPIGDINHAQVEGFLANQQGVSKKTLLNYHVGLSALWTWCVEEELVKEHVLLRIKRPKPEQKNVQPYTQAEVKELLDALGHSKAYSRPGKKECQHSLNHSERNRAIIFLLLDTGVRAEELCGLRIHQVDLKNRRITVMGKGAPLTLIHVSAVNTSANAGKIDVGSSADDDAYLDNQDFGVSSTPAEYARSNFVGGEFPHIAKGTIVKATLTDHVSHMAQATVVLTFVEG